MGSCVLSLVSFCESLSQFRTFVVFPWSRAHCIETFNGPSLMDEAPAVQTLCCWLYLRGKNNRKCWRNKQKLTNIKFISIDDFFEKIHEKSWRNRPIFRSPVLASAFCSRSQFRSGNYITGVFDSYVDGFCICLISDLNCQFRKAFAEVLHVVDLESCLFRKYVILSY